MLRLNIFRDGKLIGQDYLRENGTWGHKWFDTKKDEFERGGWRGKAKGEDDIDWTYEVIEMCALANER